MAEADLHKPVTTRLDEQIPAGPDAGRAGVLAALIMLAVQLIWRLEWSHGVIQAFPELIVAAVSRLIPLGVFGSATESYGSSAKKTLFVAVLLGIIAVGYAAGVVAGRLRARLGGGLVGRLLAGFGVTAALLLFTLVVVLPIAHLGVFASASSYQSGLLIRLIVTFAIFALSWVMIAGEEPAAELTPQAKLDAALSRRAVVRNAVWGGATVASAVIVGGVTWRFLNPKPKAPPVVTANLPTTQDIVATQRALQTQQAEPTPTPAAVTEGDTVASLDSDTAFQSPAAAPQDPAALFAQLDKQKKITPILTANKDFYHVSKNLSDPDPSSKGWSLQVKGAVNTPMTLKYDDLVTRATTKKITTLCCISNTIGGGLISTAQWTGFPLRDLLKEVGVKSPAVQVKFHSADDYEDSIPLARAMNANTMVVVGMNDVPLPPDHGGPVRMIVPGVYGMKNPKWLERIELVEKEFHGYWESRGWSQTALCQIWGRIDSPGDGDSIKAGPAIADGIASAGDRGVKRVEVSFDKGKTWADATLEPALNPPLTWVRWAYEFDAKPGDYDLVIRVTDGQGKVMDKTETDTLPDGPTGWPQISFRVKS